MIEADFETRSDIDLGKHGAYVYWESPNARVLLGSFKHGDTRFRWRYGEPCPPMLQYNIEAGGMIAAHNASFEALCFRWLHDNCGWPMPRPEQFRCTAATAAAMQLPRKLEWLGEALGLSVQKDKEGMRLIRKFSIPQKDGQFIPPEADPADFEKFHAYCDTDVETEAEADSRMVPLSDYEQSVYTLSENASDKEAAALAALENKADVIGGMDLGEYSDDVQNILIDFAQTKTNELSVRFARDMMVPEVADKAPLLTRPWRSAGFAVLKAPDVPSVLVELGYISHRDEARLLQRGDHRKQIVGSIVRSIDRYFDMTQKAGLY